MDKDKIRKQEGKGRTTDNKKNTADRIDSYLDAGSGFTDKEKEK